jgi:hypothetical protein
MASDTLNTSPPRVMPELVEVPLMKLFRPVLNFWVVIRLSSMVWVTPKLKRLKSTIFNNNNSSYFITDKFSSLP